MIRNIRPHVVLPGLVVLLGVLLAGCTSDNDAAPPNSGSDVSEEDPAAQDEADFEAIVACMRDRGWDIVVDDNDNSDESMSFGAPGVSEDQFSAYTADVEDCNRLNSHIASLDDITEDEWAAGYDRVVESAECLRGQGYDIPETPSLQAWRESFYAGEGSLPWMPWGFVPVPSMSGDEARALEAICPQVGLSTS